MTLFCCDLDGTLINQEQQVVGDFKTVSVDKGHPDSVMLLDSIDMLRKVTGLVEFVPLTTRNYADYSNVQLPTGVPHYALIDNGCTLLVDGKEDGDWAIESLTLASKSSHDMQRIKSIFLDSLTPACGGFFLQLRNPTEGDIDSISALRLDTVEVYNEFNSITFVPIDLTKGAAMNRLKERLKADYVIAAGDTSFDIPMIIEADMAFTTLEIKKEFRRDEKVVGLRTPIQNKMLKRILEEMSA